MQHALTCFLLVTPRALYTCSLRVKHQPYEQNPANNFVNIAHGTLLHASQISIINREGTSAVFDSLPRSILLGIQGCSTLAQSLLRTIAGMANTSDMPCGSEGTRLDDCHRPGGSLLLLRDT